jgi:predicted nuclease with TOPRIM domain
MDLSQIGQLLVAVVGGGFLVEVLKYFKDRRLNQSRLKIEEGQVESKIAITNLASLQATQVYLQSIIDNQGKHIDGLQEDLDKEQTANRKLRTRVFELESEVQELKMQSRAMTHRCESLEMRIAEISGSSTDSP